MEEIKKYKIGRKLTTFICDNCGTESDKPTSEYNRNIKAGRHNFCCRSCSVSYANKHKIKSKETMSKEELTHLKSISGNRRDKYTPFRYTFRNAKKRFKEFNITLDDLVDLWESQKGICPYTHIKLQLPEYKNIIEDQKIRASLDRIDSSKGYVKGNIQFISTVINYMKNTMSHEETVNFLKIINNDSSFDED